MKPTKKPLVAIIGAGIAGLSTAYTLSKSGIDVVVYERERHVGGRMSSRTKDNLVFDYGADFLADNYETLKLYARELGVEWISTMPGGRHRVIKNGIPYYLDAPGIMGLLNLNILTVTERLKLTLFALKLRFFYPDLSLFRLYDVPTRYDTDTAMNFLTKTVSENAMNYIADSFTSAMQFHRTDEISSAALIAHFKMKVTPGKDFDLRYIKGGIDSIARAITKKVSVHTDSPVSRVESEENGTARITIDTNIKTVDAVVIATNPYDAAQLLPQATYAQRTLFEGARYASTIVVSFKIPITLFPDDTHCTYVPYIENTLISGYTNELRKGDDQRSGDTTLMNVYIHEARAKELMNSTDSEIFTLIREELNKVSPEARNATLVPHDIHRWPYAMPKFYHGWPTTVADFLTNHQGKNNIYLVGDWLCAPWTEGAALLGKKTAEHIIAKLQ